ncbi:MAG: TFIIB-type zinc ribbon-containing protein [Halobacteriaceae archaeon]
MEIRGERECRDCGTRWSYFETGSVTCPACGSLRSVGVGGRAEHTDAPADLVLADAVSTAADGDLRTAAEHGAERAAEYVRVRGFVNAGELQPLDDTYLAAQELRHAGVELARRPAVGEREERYLLALLRGAPGGDRPDEVPASLHGPRGLAAAAATREYVRDVSRWLGEESPPGARDLVGALSDHRKRIEAFDGEVPPAEADRLVAAARALGEYVRGDESALAVARERLDRL